jgi:hypothetical protein
MYFLGKPLVSINNFEIISLRLYMYLLQELLNIKQASDLDMLLEDLGNLKKLGLGKLVNAFKQTFARVGVGRKETIRTSEVGNKFNRHSGIGYDSEIIEYVPIIKKWANVKKAILSNEGTAAVAFSFNEKPVALLICDENDAKSANAPVGLAWDLSKTGLTKEELEEVLAAVRKNDDLGQDEVASSTKAGASAHDKADSSYVSSWEKKNELKRMGKSPEEFKKVPYTDYEDWSDAARARNSKVKIEKTGEKISAKMDDTEVGSWDKKASKGFLLIKQDESSFNLDVDRVYGSPKQFVGVTQTTKQASEFIDALAKFGVVKITLVLTDQVGAVKRGERQSNPPIDPKYLRLFKDDIEKRLAKYKNSKIETVDDAKDFVKRVFEGGLKKIKFAGLDYNAVPDAKYLGSNHKHGSKNYVSYHDSTMNNLMSGKAIEMEFAADRKAEQWDTLHLWVKLVNGTLVPVKITYADKTNGKHKSVTEVF